MDDCNGGSSARHCSPQASDASDAQKGLVSGLRIVNCDMGPKMALTSPDFLRGQNKPNGFCDTFFLDNPIIYCTSLRCDRLWWSLWFRHASFQVAMNFWHCWLFPTCQVRVSRFCQSYFPSSRARSGTEKTRKAAVRLGSFRFVETSNRGGSVHQ